MAAEDTTQTAEAPQEGAQQPEQETAERAGVERLLEQFENLNTSVSTRLEKFEQALAAPEEEEAEEEQPLAQPAFASTDFDESGQLSAEAANRELQRIIDERVDAAVGPIHEQRAVERRTQEADRLEAEFPELQDPKVQKDIIDKSMAAAVAVGDPKLGVEPAFLRMVYLAEKAGERAAQESSGGSDREVHLEGAGGAATGEDDEEDLSDRIVNAAKKRKLFS